MAYSKVIDRFIDADQEPTRTLTPIHGYEKSDLVSLEKAVAEIKPPIDHLTEMVWVAKRNSSHPEDNLTSDESASIHLYTSEWAGNQQSIYSLLNEKLRSEKRKDLISWHSYLKLFLTALYKLPSLKKTIWRGIHGNVSDLYQEDFIWWGVSSCTKKMNITERFIGRSGVRTIFMIESINGKEITSHSCHKDEDEIILMPGTYLRVIDKWSPADDLYMIHLQEETPPCQLVASPFTSSSSSSVDTLAINKLTICTTDQPKDLAASAPFHQSKPTTLLSSPPKYKNTKLEQIINQYKDQSLLNLSGEKLTGDDMEIIDYYLLRNNKTLTTLDLSSNQIGEKGAQYLGEALQKNTTLTTLNLDSNQIGDKVVQYLGEALQKNTTLITLSLSSDQIGDKGAQYLGKALQKNTTLAQLYLWSNQIDDKGAQYLGEALEKNITLTTLNLDSNQIGDKGAQYLGEALQKNTTLTTLSLSSNQIGEKGAQYLKKLEEKKTNLKLYW